MSLTHKNTIELNSSWKKFKGHIVSVPDDVVIKGMLDVYDRMDNYSITKYPEFDKNIEYNVIDIGANIGMITLEYNDILNVKHNYCFEPDKENFDYLRHNLNILNDKTTLYNFAISDFNGQSKFYRDNRNAGNYSLIINEEQKKYGYTENTVVDVRTPEFCFSSLMENIIYKSDTQGIDLKIFVNMPKNILENIKFATLECTPVNNQSLVESFIDIAKQHFKYFYVNEKKTDIDQLSKKIKQLKSWYNFFNIILIK